MKPVLILIAFTVMLFSSCGIDAQSSKSSYDFTSKSDAITKNTNSSNISTSSNTQIFDTSRRSLSSAEAASALAQILSRYQDILSAANRENFEKQLTKPIAFSKVCEDYLYYGIIPSRSSSISIRSMNDTDKIQCLRKISDSRYYSIYKTDNGGLLYCFFNNCALYNAVFSLKSLRYSDFNSIKTGSSIEAVGLVDPIVPAILKALRSYNTQIKYTKHLLRDGLLIISYNAAKNGSYFVSKKEFYPDFKVTSVIDDFHFTYDYSILPQDYIQ